MGRSTKLLSNLLALVAFAVAGRVDGPLAAAENEPGSQAKPTVVLRPVTTSAATPAKAGSPTERAKHVAEHVDRLLADELHAGGAGKSGTVGVAVNDEVYLRRVYLDLLGRNPTPEEVTAFALDPASDKRATLVNRLLDDDQFGENWGRYWRDVILFRRSDERGQIAGPAMAEHLTTELNKNTPWDAIARSFITAEGDVRENGATGLIMAQDGDASNITAEVSRIFTGIQIQCAQCHDHKTDRWKREQFHQLAAFFPRVTVRPQRDPRTFIVAGVDVARRVRRPNQKGGQLEHFMPDLDDPAAKGTRMEPVFFVTGQKLKPGTTDEQRRQAIATWITSPTNEWFAKAFVNRIWAELVGEGFYSPIDDLGPDRDCIAPQTLDRLANSFVESKYDIKQLYRTILATSIYQSETRTRRTPNDPAFTNNCQQRLRGDQLYNALLSALGLPDVTARADGRYALVRGPRGQFNQVFGYDPSDPRDEVVGTIPQALMMMNGTLINLMISARGRTDLGKLLSSTDDDEAVAVELYLRCLGREPNTAEIETCLTHVKQTGNRSKAFEDVLWALVNSTEFLHRK